MNLCKDSLVPDQTGIDPDRRERLQEEESARFAADRPLSAERLRRAQGSMPRGVPMAWMDDLYETGPIWVTHGKGSSFFDVDGHEYLDLFVADMSAFCGHAPDPVVKAVAEQMALGSQFLLPTEDAIPVAEHLAERYGMAKWQFTLSATTANTEVIRLARAATGREIVLTFDGKYHGHGDATIVVIDDGELVPEFGGLPSSVTGQARVIAFNDIDALEDALDSRDVALVLAEPAMSNAGFIMPDPGYHDALRRLTRDSGTLLAIDETHTLVCAYAGLAHEWNLDPDFYVIGKAIAGGVPLGAYGMTDELGALIARPEDSYLVSGAAVDEVATGGTLFANALSMAAARAALTEVLTPEAFDHTGRLGTRMAEGLRGAIGRAGLGWTVVQAGAHASYFFVPTPPRHGAESRDADDPALRELMRVFMANRGIWESGWWLGPTVSVAHTEADVDRYAGVFGEFLAAVT
jgi:glutamate-1-semialdehyde 2,1-aminomutase